MATNDSLDDFFKKKDRKGNKHKKQTGLLTNNEELLKQLVIVTSATLAFKEHTDLGDEDDEQQQQPFNDEQLVATRFTDDTHKHPTHHSKTKIPETNKHINEKQINPSAEDGGGEQQQQDEWEEFQDSNAKYKELLSKFARGNNKDDNQFNDENNDDNYSDDENNPNKNNDNTNGDRDQQKDKPAWKTNRTEQQQQPEEAETNIPVVETKVEESKPSAGAYRPPQMRGGSSVTVVSGANQRVSKKKEQPNLASTDDFPTLKATVNKK